MKTLFLAACIAGVTVTAKQSVAQDLSASDIIDALRTDLPGRGERGLSVFGGDPEPPSVNLRVQFEYNEARLTDETQLTLRALGEALTSDILSGQKFEIIGHTDASGTVDYNQTLSENRARAVVDWLVDRYAVDPSRLFWSGRGESELLDIDAPEGGANRRVEIRSRLPEQGGES